jgi:hypothetical protein
MSSSASKLPQFGGVDKTIYGIPYPFKPTTWTASDLAFKTGVNKP